MKLVLLLSTPLFVANIMLAQTKKEYNTKIEKANVVNIKSGNVSVGQIIVNQTEKPKLLLSGSSQKEDSNGYFVTEFSFINSNNSSVFNDINILTDFDSPVEEVFFNPIGIAQMLEYGLSPNKKACVWKALEIKSPEKTFRIIIRSKTRVQTTISGIDGQTN